MTAAGRGSCVTTLFVLLAAALLLGAMFVVLSGDVSRGVVL